MKLRLTLLLMVASLLVYSCGGITDTDSKLQTPWEEVAIPEGFEFVSASAYGELFNNVTYYCRHIESGRIFTCTNGTYGQELVFPPGYTFVAASAYGRLLNKVTFYCQEDATGKVFVCELEETR